MTTEELRKSYPVKCEDVKVGDLMGFMYWATVKNIHEDGKILDVEDVDTKGMFSVRGKELVEKGFSANQCHEIIKVTKTQAAELLVSSHNRPLTVVFVKQDGSERTLRGRLIKPEPLLGRSMVEDLEVKEDNKVRLVDHRSIVSLKVDGVCYIVK